MRTIKISGLLFVFCLITSGCFNRSYLPQTQNTPVFTEKNELELNVAASHRTLDAQVAYSPVNKLGIMGNMAFSYDGMSCAEIGIGGYHNFESNVYLALYTGYAYCEYNYTREKEYHTILGWDNWYYNYYVHLRANRLFLQPQISMLFTEKLNLTFSVKISNWMFSRYDYRVDSYEHISGSTDPNDPNSKWSKTYSDTIGTYNKFNFTYEPALTLKTGGKYVKFMLQTGVYAQSYVGDKYAMPYRKIFPIFYRIGINATIPVFRNKNRI